MPDSIESLATKAAKALDTKDLLDHIAWTNVIKPQLDEARKQLSDMLVKSVLAPQNPLTESKEQIAGKLYGIEFISSRIERILREGELAERDLASRNIFLD